MGVSADSINSHKNFIEKIDIPFLLLSDSDKNVGKEYGVYKDKDILSKVGLGMERTTFIIDKEGKLMMQYKNVKVKNHAKDVLNFLKKNKQ